MPDDILNDEERDEEGVLPDDLLEDEVLDLPEDVSDLDGFEDEEIDPLDEEDSEEDPYDDSEDF